MATVDFWLERGVRRVILGTAALGDPGLVREACREHPGRIAVGVDARGDKVAVEGWSEVSELATIDLARQFEDAGVAAIIHTDIDRDGVMKGPNIESTLKLACAVSIPIIASGGVSSMDDLEELKLSGNGLLEGAISGRAIYDGKIDPMEASALLKISDNMLKTRIIPCLDVNNGRVVKGVNFVDLVDAGNPVEQATLYDRMGADELCFLDITASHEGRETIFDVVARTSEKCFMPVTVGGGVRTPEDIRRLLLAGADKVSINTAAIHNPNFVEDAATKFGRQCIVVAIDAKRVGDHFEIFTHGGRRETGINAVSWASRMESRGAGEILLTGMNRDGTQKRL